MIVECISSTKVLAFPSFRSISIEFAHWACTSQREISVTHNMNLSITLALFPSFSLSDHLLDDEYGSTTVGSVRSSSLEGLSIGGRLPQSLASLPVMQRHTYAVSRPAVGAIMLSNEYGNRPLHPSQLRCLCEYSPVYTKRCE